MCVAQQSTVLYIRIVFTFGNTNKMYCLFKNNRSIKHGRIVTILIITAISLAKFEKTYNTKRNIIICFDNNFKSIFETIRVFTNFFFFITSPPTTATKFTVEITINKC